jgi:hypothetical protein
VRGFPFPNPLSKYEWFLVAEHGSGERPEVVGWIQASTYRDRACYVGVAEFWAYVTESQRRRRVGDTLMAAFLPILYDCPLGAAACRPPVRRCAANASGSPLA